MSESSRRHLVSCIAGILASLLLYGVLQERLMGEAFDGEQFKCTLLLVLTNRLVTLTTALTWIWVKGSSFRPAAPVWTYAAVSASNVAATSCQYEALKHVIVSVQALGKSAKMLPVLLWGSVLLGKQYSLREYGRAIAVSLGCSIFLSTGQITSKFASEGDRAEMYGLLLMLLYLAFDGFTSSFQARLFKGYKTSVPNQMLYTTAVSAAYALVGLVMSGQVYASLAFLTRHPIALLYMILLSAAATAGQMFILQTIKAYGPLILAMVMTSRQFLTILLSCLIFSHKLSGNQWLGVFLVFSAVLDQVQSKRRNSTSKT